VGVVSSGVVADGDVGIRNDTDFDAAVDVGFEGWVMVMSKYICLISANPADTICCVASN
jgi:hypothetical protein